MRHPIGDHALVLGGSMAGLLTARVLADEYATVTVVDRDSTSDVGEQRRGVPQGRHLHGLLARGQQIIEELFPGITEEMVRGGAPAGDLLEDVRWTFSGHRFERRRSGLTVLCVRRPVLEARIRARVRALPNVVIVDHCDVVGLLTTDDGRRVTGARLLSRADGGTAESLSADLVVDATGRSSRAPVWLAELGYQKPTEERVKIGIGYATRVYRMGAQTLGGDVVITNGATPDNPRSGVMELLGDGEAMVTLMGRLGDDPPTDPDGFVAFGRSLKFPDIHDAIVNAEPVDNPVAFRFPASVRRRYERLHRFPERLLVTGDAFCSFNPVYAQGMTVAALDALVLRRELLRGDAPQPHRFFREVARVVDAPWDIAVGGDLALPGVEGRRTLKTRIINRYIARLHATAATDPAIAEAFVRVAALIDRPPQLLRPNIARRVLSNRRPGIPAERPTLDDEHRLASSRTR